MWSRTLLTYLVEALEVPGDTLGNKVRLNWRANNRLDSALPSAHQSVISEIFLNRCIDDGIIN